MTKLIDDLEAISERLEGKSQTLIYGYKPDGITLDYATEVLKFIYLTKEIIKEAKGSKYSPASLH